MVERERIDGEKGRMAMAGRGESIMGRGEGRRTTGHEEHAGTVIIAPAYPKQGYEQTCLYLMHELAHLIIDQYHVHNALSSAPCNSLCMCASSDHCHNHSFAHHISAGRNFHQQDEEGVAEVASMQRVADSDIEVEEVCGHECAEEGNPHRICMNLQKQ